MGNRYADDIKRIVGIDPNQSALGEAPIKGAIDGQRGIGYVSAKSNESKSESGTPGTTQLSSKEERGEGDTSTGENEAGEKGLDPSDPQNGVTGPSTGIKEVGTIIDGTAEEAKVTYPSTSDGGLEMFNNKSLNGITATDCTTGEPIEVRTRGGKFVPPNAVVDDNDNTVSIDWEDADTPPDVQGWEAGKYWNFTHSIFSGEGASISDGIAFGYNVIDTPQGPHTFVRVTYLDADNATLEYTAALGGADELVACSRESCTGLTPPADLAGSCPIAAPKELYWTDRSSAKFKLENGQFTTSQFDQVQLPSNVNPSSRLDFCYNDGNSNGTMEVTKDGGFMVYGTASGSPAGTVRVYDSNGSMVGAGDATQTYLQSHRPAT